MKKLFVLVLCLSVIVVVGFVGYRGYHRWKRKHLMAQVHSFIAKADGANAMLALRQVLEVDRNNLEASKLMVEFASLARSPQALFWASRVVDLEPGSLTNRLVLARIALGAGDNQTAHKALEGVDAAGKKTPLYLKLLGGLEIAERRFPEAEASFAEAARLEPTNALSRLSLAVLRMQRKDPAVAADARAELVALTAKPEARAEALRQLTQDSIRHTNLNGALGFSKQLLTDTNANFSDRLLHLDILHTAANAQESGFLASLQGESATNSAKAYEVARWLLNGGKPQAALVWIKSLPRSTHTNLPVPMIESDCYMALKDWSGLLTNTSAAGWADLDCLRLLSRVRAHKEQNSVASAKTEWAQALKQAGNNLQLLVQMLRSTTAWNWKPEQEELLWAVVNRFPNERWAIAGLADRLYEAGNTRGLQTLFALALQRDPENLSLMNNLASAALLTESWDKKPLDLAREIYTKSPTNAAFVSTYAYALLAQKQPAEALKTIERLTAEQLQDPSIALYYGLILKATGNAAKAGPYFVIAAKARMLPEEQKLLERARR